MAAANKQECDDPPSSQRSAVWEHFTVAVMTTDRDKWIVQKQYADIVQLLSVM